MRRWRQVWWYVYITGLSILSNMNIGLAYDNKPKELINDIIDVDKDSPLYLSRVDDWRLGDGDKIESNLYASHYSHSSHSSHYSHSSHTSHYSGVHHSTEKEGSSLGYWLGGGAVAYGIYRYLKK